VGLGERERSEAEGVLGGQAERFATGGQHRQAGAGGQQGEDESACRVEQVLAVVDNEQAGPVAEEGEAGGEDITVGDGEVHRRGERERDGRRIGHRCQ
jgi:hypothetical protein